MTREEFCALREEWGIDELVNFARDQEIASFEDIIDASDLDSQICEDIRDSTDTLYWYQIRDKLDNIDSDYEYYYRGERLEYTPVDEYDLYESILSDMDYADLWDEPEDDSDDEDEDDEEEPLFVGLETSVREEPEVVTDPIQEELKAGVFSIDEFIASGAGDMMVLREDAERYEETLGAMRKAADEAFAAESKSGAAARRFKVGDYVMANEKSDGVLSITCKRRGWRGAVIAILPDGVIRVCGRGDNDVRDDSWVVDEDKFDLDDSFSVPKEDLFVF